ncbi:TonB-dependent receptor plug domain-containing protein [Caulobacter mirabilis]|uniref:TonB-dependent receptor n=1 Tax=Caulobacter mirabilis TaxID=69666 RepID=A0A2D2AY46_9CAUL|nr:TonB-dependent receptor [Caulobacter mirabilis]ATQ42934.1 TonB-dependent receptor [Caulobacter mirabilis]
MSRTISHAALAAALSLVPAAALAETTFAPSVSELVVTGQSLEETLPRLLADHGYDVEVVTAEQIRDGGFVDVSQAVELLVPGAFMTTQAGPFSYVNLSLQGSRSSDVLWTVDGVRINNRLYNSTSPADTLPAAMVDRIEVLKGGHGVLYGTQASAGVINVVTRPFSADLAGSLSAGADTNDGLHLNGAISDSFGGHKLVAWLSKDKSDGYEIFDAYQPNLTDKKRGYDVLSGGVKYGYDFTDDLSLMLTYIRTSAALDYPSQNGVSVNDRDEQIGIVRLDYTPDSGPQFFIKSYYHQWDTDYYTKPNPSKYWGYKDFGVSGLARFQMRLADVDVGYDFQNYKGRDEVLLIEGETEQVHALYGQVRTNEAFSDRARLTAGLRYNKASGAETVVWSASGVYDLTDDLYVEASGGTSFLLPDAEKLYGIDPCCAHGNPNLEPEESLNFNAGLGGRLNTAWPLTWQVTAYWRDVKNLITTSTVNPPPGFDSVYVNIDGKTKVSGGELVVRGQLGEDFSYTAAYSYSRERNRTTGLQIAGRPEHSGKLTLNWAPAGRPYGVTAAAKYVGQTETPVTGFGVQPYGDYTVFDLSGHWYVDGDARRTRLNLRLENALDEDYATSVSSAVLRGSSPATRFLFRRLGMPRTAYISLSYRF